MSETMGRCRSEVDDCYGSLPLVAIADAIDRLAEDVAAIKAAILPQTTEERDAAISERDEARAEVERLRAELAARPAANSPEIPDSSPADPPPAGHGISPGLPRTQPTGNAAPAPLWLTDRERHVLSSMLSERTDWSLHWADDVQPGPITGREHGIVLAYRDALDKAGVAWKAVPRE